MRRYEAINLPLFMQHTPIFHDTVEHDAVCVDHTNEHPGPECIEAASQNENVHITVEPSSSL